ncbi:MAG: hypothetical protein IIX96_02150 [Clostridia bacterium]|nr:hypothetical protein [Clostridia bacterium]
MKKAKYQSDLPRRMYSYFCSYEGAGAPSFSAFARSVGITLRTLNGYRSRRKFDEAYLECSEIRRDYLINNALCKRADSSFTKFILTSEYGMGAEVDKAPESFKLTVEVVE